MTAKYPLVYYIRHGQTDWNKARRIQGQTDIPLNETGHVQAKAIADALVRVVPDPAQFDFVVSPLTRARQTMGHILKAYGLPEDTARIEPRVREVSFGDRDGWTWPELNAAGIDPTKDPEGYFHWVPPNGESYAMAAKRIKDWLDDQQKPVIIVAHGGISRIIRGAMLGKTGAEFVGLPVPQTKFYKIEAGEITWFRA